MVAAGEGGTAANDQHKVIGARLGWADKRFGVSAATTQTENNLTVSGKFKDHAIGGQADIGVVRLSAAYRRLRAGRCGPDEHDDRRDGAGRTGRGEALLDPRRPRRPGRGDR